MAPGTNELIISSDIPARLEKLPWSWWHTRITLLLGIGWILDAIETTFNTMTLRTLGSVYNVSDMALTYINSMWMLGALFGAFTFGTLSDRFGRRSTFLATILTYTICTCLNAAIPSYAAMMILRFCAGFGVGGENAAVHTVIQEFIPARHRGKVSVLISASWDLASTATSFLASVCTSRLSQTLSWRVGMLVGGFLGSVCFLLRLRIPESPRWLLSRNRLVEAEEEMRLVERKCVGDSTIAVSGNEDLMIVSRTLPTPPLKALKQLFTLHLVPTLYSAGLNAVLAFEAYGFPGVSQLGIFPDCGISEAATSMVFVAGTGVNIISNPLFAILLDRVGRKVLIPFLYLCTMICATGFFPAGYSCQYGALMAVTVCWKFFEAPAANCAIAAGTEVFPIALMSMGCGLSHAVGRLFAAISQTALLAVYNAGEGGKVSGVVSLTLCLYGIALALCALWYVKGVEGASQQLEAMTKTGMNEDAESVAAEVKCALHKSAGGVSEQHDSSVAIQELESLTIRYSANSFTSLRQDDAAFPVN